MTDKLKIEYLITAAREVYPDNEVLQKLAVTQAVHESGILRRQGASQLAREHKNLFGIKGKGTAGSALMMTWEHIKGKDIKVRAPFAKNHTFADSFRQHARLMRISRYKKVVACDNIYEAFIQIWKAGYATDPKYPKRLEDVYNTHIKKYYY